MRIISGIELNRRQFDVVLKGLLHGYKPVKSDVKMKQSEPALEDALNLIVVGASVAGTTAYIKNILKGDCPDNILCIGADYVLRNDHSIDMDGFIVFLPELLYVSDAGLAQNLTTLERIKRALSPDSEVQTYYGPGTMALMYSHQFNRWLKTEAFFDTFEYNSKPEGRTLVFNAALFQEYGNLYIKESNGLHRETYPIHFPRIEAERVLFDLDLSQFSDAALAHIMLRCQEVNQHVRQYLHIDLAYRQFEFNEWLSDSNFFGFTSREDDDRDTKRDVLTWDGAPKDAAICVGASKTSIDVGPNSITVDTQGNLEVKGNLR